MRRKLKKVDPFRPIEFARWAQDQFAAVNQSIALLSTYRKTVLPTFILPSFIFTSSHTMIYVCMCPVLSVIVFFSPLFCHLLFPLMYSHALCTLMYLFFLYL